MTATTTRIALLVALALLGAVLVDTTTASAQSCHRASYTDPAGDVARLDIVTYDAAFGCTGNGMWKLSFNTDDSWATSDMDSIAVALDTDGNTSNSCGGYEYLVVGAFHVDGPSGVVLRVPTCDAGTWTESGTAETAKPGPSAVTLAFHESSIGSPAEIGWAADLSQTGVDGPEDIDSVPDTGINRERPAGGTGTPTTATTSTTSTTATTGGTGTTTTTTTNPPTTTTAPPRATVLRLSGADRFETAIAASVEGFREDSAGGAVLVRADSFADALAGSVLAQAMNGPLLLTTQGVLEARTRAEIARVLATGKTVVILGGTQAVSDAVEPPLRADGFQVARLAGGNRFETATAVASAMPSRRTYFLADGTTFPDALIAASAARTVNAAVLLTAGTTMPGATKAFLDAHPGHDRGSVGAAAKAADPGAPAIAGVNPADTSRQMAERFHPQPTAIGLASMASYADGLAGAAHVARAGGPLLLTTPDHLSLELHDYIRAAGPGAGRVFLYGGPNALSEEVRSSTEWLLR